MPISFLMKNHLEFINKQELIKFLLSEGRDDYMVIDEKVKSHLPLEILSSKKIFWLQNPEEQKIRETYFAILDQFLDSGFTRADRILGIGGGATTDLAGFVASTILRGVEWISVPTTLLGMVDGAIGGKVGINTKHGKNQIGSFHLPKKVLISTDFLETLNEEEILSGKGEILKYCFLDTEIFESVINKAPMELVIKQCAEYKKKIVESDFKESNLRMILNFGHTIGHCYERILKISHGMAVIHGIKAILVMFDLNERLNDFETLLVKLNIQIQRDLVVDRSDLEAYLLHDKKRRHSITQVIVTKDIGNPEIISLEQEDLSKKIGRLF